MINNSKIVIVEDNPSLNELYTMAFSMAGFEVLSCLDGRRVEGKILKFNPDIILLDIMMPEVDGLKLLKSLKTYKELDSLIIIASNLLNDSIMKEALNSGAAAFLNKSDFTPDEIVEKISEYLGIYKQSETEKVIIKKYGKKILIIDDNEDELDLLSMSFKEKGCIVLTAKNGIEGMTQIVENRPDLVLADVIMADMNGFDLLESINENIDFKVKVIMTSLIDDPEKIKKAKNLGAIDFIQKSQYLPGEIAEKVIDYLECEI